MFKSSSSDKAPAGTSGAQGEYKSGDQGKVDYKEAPSGTLTHEAALNLLKSRGIRVTSTSGVVNASRREKTTSFQGIRDSTVKGFLALIDTSGTGATITGGLSMLALRVSICS